MDRLQNHGKSLIAFSGPWRRSCVSSLDDSDSRALNFTVKLGVLLLTQDAGRELCGAGV